MKRYFRFLWALINISTKRYLEQRVSTFGFLILKIANLALMLLFIGIYFSHTKDIFGWTKYQVIFLTGIFQIVSSLFSGFFLRSINFIPSYVQHGELDNFLTKPINSQFYLSLRLNRMPDLISALSGLVVVLYALAKLNLVYSLMGWIVLFISLILGLAIWYGLYFSLATLAIWMGRFASLPDLYYIMYEPLAVPINILGKSTSFVLTFIIPLGFIITVPISVFLNKSPWFFIIGGLAFALFSVGFSSWFWNFSLRHYTSASS